jgi:hypothetical protein
MKEVREKARKLAVKVPVGWNKAMAIRAVQTAEGNEPCFGSGLYATCGQGGCCFRQDCEMIPGNGQLL